MKLTPTQTAHHWNYNLIEDRIIIERKLHRLIHRYLILDEASLCYKKPNGQILSTREEHEAFINEIKNIFYNEATD